MISPYPVLVVGADGFIGKQLVARFRSAGVSYRELNGPSSPNGFDVRDIDIVRRTVSAIDFNSVVYLAGHIDARFSTDHFHKVMSINVSGLVNFIASVWERKPQKIIFTGSYKQYGANPPPFDESMSTDPRSAYAVSKDCCERILAYSCVQAGIRYLSLRLATVYGPQQDDSSLLIPGTIERCLLGQEIRLTDGSQERDLVFVGDVCEAIQLGLESSTAEGIVNIGGGRAYPVREIVEAIHAMTGKKALLHFGALPQRANEIQRMVGKIDRARAMFGWSPATSLEAGLEATVVYVRERLRDRLGAN